MQQLGLFSICELQPASAPPAVDPLGPTLPNDVHRGLARHGWRYECTDRRERDYVHTFVLPAKGIWQREGDRIGKTTGGALATLRALDGVCWRCGGRLTTTDEVLNELCAACEEEQGR